MGLRRDESVIERIRFALANVSINDLNFFTKEKFNRSSTVPILNYIRNCSIEHLFLSCGVYKYLLDNGSFFTEAVRLVSSVEVRVEAGMRRESPESEYWTNVRSQLERTANVSLTLRTRTVDNWTESVCAIIVVAREDDFRLEERVPRANYHDENPFPSRHIHS
ncbi:hypothetical protein PENTCL1PPCAC_26039 [Pristionchus entomophagus]|uniref:Uncharacterized protein n=1 Tax=Pristionchus entomophagus TaxID=358040 RepID=A0AAV5UC10_9BILA|nr:hypothetical protein PENTCL1PPCAC_26039 [Pristionchus entomophagus]